jgi:hypothetical protein
MPKAVLTPEGRFASVRLAATYYGINYESARKRTPRRSWGRGDRSQYVTKPQ